MGEVATAYFVQTSSQMSVVDREPVDQHVRTDKSEKAICGSNFISGVPTLAASYEAVLRASRGKNIRQSIEVSAGYPLSGITQDVLQKFDVEYSERAMVEFDHYMYGMMLTAMVKHMSSPDTSAIDELVALLDEFEPDAVADENPVLVQMRNLTYNPMIVCFGHAPGPDKYEP